MDSQLQFQEVESRIIVIRNIEVMADADVAVLFGVPTKEVNQAVRNNPEKFKDDYMFILKNSELEYLRSNILTTNVSPKSRTETKVFTEKGLYMLATILKSHQAKEATFAIIETFAKVRKLQRELVELHQETDEQKQKTKMEHFGNVLADIVMPDLKTEETESTLELNFLVGKLKHTVKRRR